MNQIPYWRTSLGREEAQRVADCICNEQLSQGEITRQFEESFAKAMDVPYAVATTSGSMALLLALMALGIGRDDEVIVPDITFVATAHAALMVGAKVVLVDTRPDIPIMDVSLIGKKITKRTKAIMPVHLNGRAVDMRELNHIAREYGLYIVEDACQAMFSKNEYDFLGTQSNAGCFSLGVTKLITTAQGGMVVTKDPKVYEQMKLIRTHGVQSTFETDSYGQMGFNFKFTDIQAGIGLEQLKKIPQKMRHIHEIYQKYEQGLNGNPAVGFMPLQPGEIPLYVDIECEKRESIREYMDTYSIQSRPMYPNLHLAPHLANTGKFPCAERFQKSVLYLPSGPEQPLPNVQRVIEVLNQL